MNLHEYIAELDRLYRTGRATEHTYRPALQALLDTALPALAAINEPARTDCGAPDFILVRRRDNLPVAFVEAKDIDDPDLDGRRQHREQFDRYRHSLAHIAFTDYLDFHLYEDGEPVAQVRVADVSDGRIRPRPKAEEAFNALLSRLTSGGPQRITSASRLAAVMAAKARLLADTVGRALAQRADSYDDESLHGLFRAFRNVLIHDAEPEEFADLYAQTITYGLFAARLHDPTPETFSRQEAAGLIPKTNPFLRRFFQHLAGADLDGRVAWIVDDLATAFGAAIVGQEAAQVGRADRVKRDTPVMVMMGNPPYSVSSQNKGEWITELIRIYKSEPGNWGKKTELHQLQERNIQPLSDDYIKFIRLAHYYVQKNGEGIVAFITNNSFLDGIIHRGMRWQLLRAFDSIYILDLHGNAKKHETTPDGSKDENVFNIQQGVSINLFVRTGPNTEDQPARVFHHDLYGLRRNKFAHLDKLDINSVPWQELTPCAPYYFFVPKDFSAQAEYDRGFRLDELFINNVSGVKTSKDKVVVCDTMEQARQLAEDFQTLDVETLRTKYNTGRDSRDWSVERAKEDVTEHKDTLRIVPYMYRPFDDRYIVLTGKTNGIVAWPRYRSFACMSHPGNLSLIVCKQLSTQNWHHCFLSTLISDLNSISINTKEISYVFPLFINTGEAGRNFETKNLIPNFRPEVVARIEEGLGESVEPTELFDYIYAVLHSPAYRECYREMLRIDFPRVPYPQDAGQYHRLAAIGARLRRTHLMEGAPTWPDGLTYPVGGSNEVSDPHWADGRAYVNDTQYVGGVAEAVWNAAIGGYQPVQKWLKDRRGRRLTHDDIAHYARTLRALSETLRLMREVNTILTLPA